MATASAPLRNPSNQLNSSQLSLPNRSKASLLFLGHIREIRAKAQNLQRYTNELRDDLTNQHLHIADIAKTWQTVQMAAYQRHDARVKELFTVIRKLMEDNPVLLDHNSDTITTMEDVWERVDPHWPRFPENEEPDENAMLAQIAKVDAILYEVIRVAEKLTLPDRINDRLRELRVGQTINFHAEFSEELPEPMARMRALNYLHDHPLIVLGVVDVENGLIYRASSRIWRRRLSPIYIALPIILGGVLVYLGYTFLPLPKDNHDVSQYVIAYISVIVGSIAHAAVDMIKQYRTSKGQTFTALGDMLMWLHVKEAPIIAVILLLWIGFVGLIVSQQGRSDWEAAFFIGYSIDSFVDLFLLRFTYVASTRTDAMRTQLTQPSG